MLREVESEFAIDLFLLIENIKWKKKSLGNNLYMYPKREQCLVVY